MKKEKLIILGAGNVGGYISYNIHDFGNYDIVGFLDDDIEKHGKTFYGHKVLGPVSLLRNYAEKERLSVVVGIANPAVRKKIAKSIADYNLTFPNFIAKNAWLSPGVSMGKGVIIYPGVSINYECNLKDFVIVNMNCAIGHNCTISSFSTMAPGVNLGGFTFVGDGVDLCIGVSTRQGIRIGAQSLVGGQAMVVKNIPANVKVKGIPAYIYDAKPPFLKPIPTPLQMELAALSFGQKSDRKNISL